MALMALMALTTSILLATSQARHYYLRFTSLVRFRCAKTQHRHIAKN